MLAGENAMTILVVLILYLVFMYGTAYWFSKKNVDEKDYIQGTKKIPGWVLAVSERATSESVYLLIGATGFAYATGVGSAFFLASCVLGTVVLWLFLGNPIRKEADKYGATTLTGYLACKFRDRERGILYSVSSCIVFFYLFQIAVQFSGAGKTAFTVFGVDPKIGMLLAAFVVATFTMLGGYTSVVWTDMVQGMLMVSCLTILPIIGWFYCDARGIDPFAVMYAGTVDGVKLGEVTGGLKGFSAFLLLFANFNWFFTYLGGQPALTARLMSINSDKEYRIATVTAIVWICLAYAGVYFIGVMGNGMFGVNGLPDREMVLPMMITTLLPPVLAGLFIAAIISAMVSTADSIVLVIAASVVEDVMTQGMRKNLSSQQKIRYSRFIVLLCCLAGLGIGWKNTEFLQVVVSWMNAGIGSVLSGVVIISLFDKKATATGVVSGVVMGIIVTIVWMTTPLENIVSARFMSFATSFLVAASISRLYPRSTNSTPITN